MLLKHLQITSWQLGMKNILKFVSISLEHNFMNTSVACAIGCQISFTFQSQF